MLHNLIFRLSPPERVETILLNLMLPIGDTLFATPTIRALRKRYPDATIVALVFPTNAGVLRSNPDVDEIVVHATRRTFELFNYVHTIAGLRRRHFDLAVEFRPFAWYISVLCGVWRRLAFDIPLYQWFLPLGGRPWRSRHAVASYASLVHPLGLAIEESRLVVQTTEHDRDEAHRFLAEQSIDEATPLIALHPGGEGFHGMKRWEARRFSILADRLAERYGAHIALVGGRDERDLARRVADGSRIGPLVTNGRLSLGGSIALLERAMLFVGDDSAPLHMAASLGIPTVGIFGPTSTRNYAPIGPRTAVVRSGLVCSPCVFMVGSDPVWKVSRCRVPTCLHTVGVDDVLAAAARVIDHTSARAVD